MKRLLVLAIVAIAGVSYASDEANPPQRVSVPLTAAYIPGGFDSNDRTQFMIEGYFPSTCYRVGPYEKSINTQNNEIEVKQTAYKYNGQCLWMMVSFSQNVKVGLLKASDYVVKDVDSGRILGEMPVSTAKNSGPDDYLYANVSDAYVGYVDGNERAIVVQGELPGDCWTIKEKKVVADGKKVLTVLPIIEQVRQNNCSDYRLPFITTVTIPKVDAGRYLLNVRSLNGESVNKLVDL